MLSTLLKDSIPYIPIYVVIAPLLLYIINHEKKHSRIVLYLKLICDKLDIRCEEKE